MSPRSVSSSCPVGGLSPSRWISTTGLPVASWMTRWKCWKSDRMTWSRKPRMRWSKRAGSRSCSNSGHKMRRNSNNVGNRLSRMSKSAPVSCGRLQAKYSPNRRDAMLCPPGSQSVTPASLQLADSVQHRLAQLAPEHVNKGAVPNLGDPRVQYDGAEHRDDLLVLHFLERQPEPDLEVLHEGAAVSAPGEVRGADDHVRAIDVGAG